MLQAKDDRALSAGELVSFLKVIRPYVSKDFSLFLLGGEPLLASDTTLKLAEFAWSQRWPCLVSTNGQKVTREFAAAAHRTRLQVQVSLDSPHEDRHDALRGQGTFEKAIAGVRILREAGVHVVISMV